MFYNKAYIICNVLNLSYSSVIYNVAFRTLFTVNNVIRV